MNILGIGTDIVQIARIKRIWLRFWHAFARKILSQQELVLLEVSKDPIAYLAKRFAAKEAFVKALGTGFRPDGVRFTDIIINNDPLGRPYLDFTNRAKEVINKSHVSESHLSLSDEKDYAVAFVILVGITQISL